jgi:hypothetical protein
MQEDPVRQDGDDDDRQARALAQMPTLHLVQLRHAVVLDRKGGSPRAVAFAKGRLAAIDDELKRRALTPAGKATR